MSRTITSDHGFDILRDAAELKLRFDRVGPAGLHWRKTSCGRLALVTIT